MEKIKLKCCPFCGDIGAPDLIETGEVAFVRCNNCKTYGPYVRLDAFLPFDFKELDDDYKDAAWDKAAREAKRRAVINWNCRPPMTDVFPEDLAAFEQFGETIESLEKEADDARLQKIEDLVDGTIDHFDRDDAMDLLYQIKEVLKNGSSVYKD